MKRNISIFFFHFEFNSEDPKEADKSNDTFAARMQLQVIRNLELSIENIHIVYEDKSTKPSHPFAMGITLNYIKLRVE
jgi:vacuolar protein sorting-associated protein 13A/C